MTDRPESKNPLEPVRPVRVTAPLHGVSASPWIAEELDSAFEDDPFFSSQDGEEAEPVVAAPVVVAAPPVVVAPVAVAPVVGAAPPVVAAPAGRWTLPLESVGGGAPWGAGEGEPALEATRLVALPVFEDDLEEEVRAREEGFEQDTPRSAEISTALVDALDALGGAEWPSVAVGALARPEVTRPGVGASVAVGAVVEEAALLGASAEVGAEEAPSLVEEAASLVEEVEPSEEDPEELLTTRATPMPRLFLQRRSAASAARDLGAAPVLTSIVLSEEDLEDAPLQGAGAWSFEGEPSAGGQASLGMGSFAPPSSMPGGSVEESLAEISLLEPDDEEGAEGARRDPTDVQAQDAPLLREVARKARASRAAPSEGYDPTRLVSVGKMGLGEVLGQGLGEPWASFLGELHREIMARREAGDKAGLLHDAADALRLAGDRWREVALSLDAEALDLNPRCLPAWVARVVDAARVSDDRSAMREVLTEATAALDGGNPEEVRLGTELRLTLASLYELDGEREEAARLYREASEEAGSFQALNHARLALAEGSLDGFVAALEASAREIGEGRDADAQRALVCLDAAEALRREGRLEEASARLRAAVAADPTGLAAHRDLQLIAWQTGDLGLEIEGLQGQLALLVEQGRSLRKADARHKALKRRAAARFFRLGQLLSLVGRREEAVAALRDALGVKRNELLYLRALERVAHETQDWAEVNESLTRQVGLIVDTSLQALLLVDQAHVRLKLGDVRGALSLLGRSLEIAPSCLPARISLGRLFLERGEWRSLLALRDGGLPGEEPDPLLQQAGLRAAEAWRRGEILELMLQAPQEALPEYLLAVRWAPGGGPWVGGAERLLMAAGRWEELAGLYARVHGASPSPRAQRELWRRGVRLAVWRGVYADAALALGAWVEAQDVDAALLEEAAQLSRKSGDWVRSAQLWERVAAQAGAPGLARDPHGVHVWEAGIRALRWLAHLYEGPLGEPERAQAARARLLALRPGEPKLVEELRGSLARQGAWGRLAEVLEEQARSAAPRDRRDLLLECARVVRRQLRDKARARGLLEGLAAEQPEDGSVADALEEALREGGDWAALAQRLLERALRVWTGDAQQALRCASEAGWLRREALGDPEGALRAFSLGLELAPGSQVLQRAVGELLRELGRDEALAEHLGKWLGRAPAQEWVGVAGWLASHLELRLGRGAEALALREEIEAHAPGDAENGRALVRLGLGLGRRGTWLGAVRGLARREEDRGEGLARLLRVARAMEEGGEPAAQVLEGWRAALAVEPRNPEGLRGLERALRRLGMHSELLKIVLEQAKAAEGVHRVHHMLRIADVYEEMGRLGDAVEILRKVSAMEPDFELAKMRLVGLLEAQGDDEGVAALEEDLAKGAPDDASRRVHVERAAQLWEKVGRVERADPLWWRLLELAPGHEGAWRALRARVAQVGDAQEQGRRLLGLLDARLASVGAQERPALLREAVGLALERDPEKAQGYLDEWLDLRPEEGAALELAAKLAERQGQPQRAVRLWSQWLDSAEPGPGRRAQVLLHVASLSLRALRDAEGAEAFLDELLRLEPQHGDGRELLAQARVGLGRYAQACDLYKDLFEERVTAGLALEVGRLLEVHLGRNQEALSWYMRAQDLDLFSREAVERFVELLQRLSISAPQVASGRVLRDRLDGLVASTRAALQEAPWDLARYVQLERLHALRGDAEGRAMVLGVLSYFGVVEGGAEEVGRRGSWLEGGAVGLSEDELRRLLWPSEADGLRRNVLSMVWEAVSGVEPDDPKARGLRRGPPKPGDKRDEHPGLASVTRLAHALRLGGVELLVHPTDAYAVLPLLTPDPLLALGESTLERLGEPFHLFRVAHALESLRDGKLLVLRPSGMGVLAAVDELLRSVLPESGALPLFAGADKGGAWVKDGGAKLKRTVSRRTARDLRAALEVESFALPGDAASWTQACGCAAARAGLLACGRVGAALDAVAGTSFSAEREVGPARAQEVVAALRGRAQAGVLEDLLRFQVSEAHASLRRRLGLSKEGA